MHRQIGLLFEGFEISWFGEWHRNKCGHPVHRTTPKLILNKTTIKEDSLKALKRTIETYCPISVETWEEFKTFCVLIHLGKDQFFTKAGEIPQSFSFVYAGLLRVYVTDTKGNEYNKVFFPENTFPGSMVALLTSAPSNFSIVSLEKSHLLQINFEAYRHLLMIRDDLKLFHILYLEKNWLVEKEKREVALVQESATERYLSFKEHYPALEKRISQYHIASHLGITPTQLSRIRKNLANPKKD